MAPKRELRKVVNDTTQVRCASGPGIIREEVWEDKRGEVARYNLAFINHFLTNRDHGRVLGYDNSHGYHHRHFKGDVRLFIFTGYEVLLERFFEEVDELKKEKA